MLLLFAAASASSVVDELARKDPQITSCAGVATSESVVLHWTVTDGRASGVRIEGDEALGGCVAGRVVAWTFPTDGAYTRRFVFPDPGSTTVVVPALFEPTVPAPSGASAPHVSIASKGIRVELRSRDDDEPVPLESLRPGSYRVMAYFEEDDPSMIASLDLKPNDRYIVKCQPALKVCRISQH
ncbi:MAG: hypothetical protein H6736_04025 [Alphaproteobacteria bacterium]|nr:hypothetical protein [Alphaproteobacteria bacterium]